MHSRTVTWAVTLLLLGNVYAQYDQPAQTTSYGKTNCFSLLYNLVLCNYFVITNYNDLGPLVRVEGEVHAEKAEENKIGGLNPTGK